MSGVSLPHAASSLQLIPAINPVSPPFLGRYQYLRRHQVSDFWKSANAKRDYSRGDLSSYDVIGYRMHRQTPVKSLFIYT